MTGQDINLVAMQRMHNDTSNKVWLAEWVTDAINAGVRELCGLYRPDALLSATLTLTTIADLTDLAGTVSVADKWKACLAEYVQYYLLGIHGKEPDNHKQAAEHYEAFVRLAKAG